MDVLGKLFSSGSLVKIMRLFLLHPDIPFENKEIQERSRVNPRSLRTEIDILKNIGFIQKKKFTKTIQTKHAEKTGKSLKKNVSGWVLNRNFEYLSPLRLLLLNPNSVNKKDLLKRIKSTGKIGLVVISGIFIREENSRIDLLVVGDKVKRRSFNTVLKMVESEIGKEISYALMDTEEFMYRFGMYDKFVRDILDYTHEKLFNRLGIE